MFALFQTQFDNPKVNAIVLYEGKIEGELALSFVA